jgi:predicted nucleic acid-binding protein
LVQRNRCDEAGECAKAEKIFDTDVLIWASRGNEKAARLIDSSPDRALAIISLRELVQAARSRLEVREIQQSLRRLGFQILSLSEAIGSTAAALIEQHALTYGIQVADALVAATAIESGHPLCTGNAKHFRPIRGLSRVKFHP